MGGDTPGVRPGAASDNEQRKNHECGSNGLSQSGGAAKWLMPSVAKFGAVELLRSALHESIADAGAARDGNRAKQPSESRVATLSSAGPKAIREENPVCQRRNGSEDRHARTAR
jgi:hypothetical protein